MLLTACEGPLGEWFAYAEDDPSAVIAGRSLPDVLEQLSGGRGPGFDDALAELAGRRTSDGVRYACPCCDRWTLDEPPPGTYAICDVCGWEDDDVQFRDPDYRGGANGISLREAREKAPRAGRGEPR